MCIRLGLFSNESSGAFYFPTPPSRTTAPTGASCKQVRRCKNIYDSFAEHLAMCRHKKTQKKGTSAGGVCFLLDNCEKIPVPVRQYTAAKRMFEHPKQIKKNQKCVRMHTALNAKHATRHASMSVGVLLHFYAASQQFFDFSVLICYWM